jgi:hypothetical protein
MAVLSKKERYVKEITSHLMQALRIINDVDVDKISLQELKAAAAQATQASTLLHRLEGIVESERN